MKRLACILALCVLFVFLQATVIRLNEAQSGITCQTLNTTGLRVEFNLGSFSSGPDGHLELSSGLSRFVTGKSLLPTLSFHVALPCGGEYTAQTNYHRVITELDAQDTTTANLVTVSRPYKLRELWGMEIRIAPFGNENGKLIVADHVTINLASRDDNPAPVGSATKLNPWFLDIYKHQFINLEYRYPSLAEYGSMAVICPPQFVDLVTPWVVWKNQKGIPTTVYSTDETGHTYEEIRGFIRALYQNDPNLTFVQLVGDYAQVPCVVNVLAGNIAGRDAYYSLMDDGDWYPDIYVGRFSAETSAELYTQVQRSIAYERDIADGDWLARAAGVCAINPPIPGDDGEYNWDHLDKIRGQLLDFGYTSVDRVYANEGADTQDLVDCLNSGRSLVNYSGEGYPEYWITPQFSVTDAENLLNTDMLPFIHVTSCWTGQFYDGTCLAEALMRSRDPSAEEARGAIAVYASAPEQGIYQPMEAQDHTMELLVSSSKLTIGGLCFNGASNMIDEYGEAGVYCFISWVLFGDASLMLRTKPAEDIAADVPGLISPGATSLTVGTGRAGLLAAISEDNVFKASGFTDDFGSVTLNWTDPAETGDRLLLTLTGYNLRTAQKDIFCYEPGQAHLQTDIAADGQLVEPEVILSRTAVVRNDGSVPAQNVRIVLESQDANVIPVVSQQFFGHLLPGEQAELSLSFRISRQAIDLSIVSYDIVVSADGFSQSYHLSEAVHAPVLEVVSSSRQPQPNWIKPGDEFTVSFTFTNLGSVTLRDLTGVLDTRSGYLLCLESEAGEATLPESGTASFAFSLKVTSACPPGTILAPVLRFTAANGRDLAYTEKWFVTEPGTTLESFETGDLLAFPWLYSSQQWAISADAADGSCCLKNAAINAASINIKLELLSLDPGELSFLYRKSDQGNSPTWRLMVNEGEAYDLEGTDAWLRKVIPLAAGKNTLIWEGTDIDSSSCFLLDAIEFPARTVFTYTSLLSDTEGIEAILAPGEIRHIPVRLSSADGKYIQFEAILEQSALITDRLGGISISCNRTSFTPGALELYMFTLHNPEPRQTLMQASIGLPDGVLAVTASPLSSPGEAPLLFTGAYGSLSELTWSSPEGSLADSLLAGVRLVTDAHLESLSFTYEVISLNALQEEQSTQGTIELAGADAQTVCVSVSPASGELHGGGILDLELTANQNLAPEQGAEYVLTLFYNGINQLSLPVTIRYDADPEGFYDVPHLEAYPNPCADHTTFAYAVPEDGYTELAIYNIRGQRVKTLVREDQAKGYYRSVWGLDDDYGRKVGTGVYLCRLGTVSGMGKTVKCVVIK
jgi:hypothetical protein